MKRVMLIVAYDGTNYCGWQVQNNGDTIEGELNRALSSLLKEEIVVIGASRTDSGVHALGNVAVFDTEARMPAEKMAYALNSRLPEDIRVQQSFRVDDQFHPRKTSCIKTYEYRILNREFELPGERLNSHFFRKKLDVAKMREACLPFLGEHDFKSFCSIHTQAETTVRTIYSLDVTKEGDIIRINIPENKLDVLVSDEELAARRAKWQPREPKITTGYLARYHELVTSGNRGAVLEAPSQKN